MLQSVVGPGASIKYIDQVVRYAPPNVEFIYFSWRAALTQRFDVFHVHWPEVLIRPRAGGSMWLRSALAHLLLWRLRLSRIAVVRTLHNVRPHNAVTRRQERFLLKLDAVTDTFVHLNGCSPTSPGAIHARIPHGDYREQFGSTEPADYRPGRFLVIGRIEPYKGVDRFLATFARSGIAGEECRVVGSAPEGLRTTLESQISSWSRADVNVSARFEFVSDAEMADEITSAQVIVLPYEEMLNSGIALVALSLGRPILVPRNCANTELAHEAGPEWVIQYDGAFGEDALKAARSASPQSPDSRPNLDGRDWRSVAERYAEVFRSARHVRKSSNV